MDSELVESTVIVPCTTGPTNGAGNFSWCLLLWQQGDTEPDVDVFTVTITKSCLWIMSIFIADSFPTKMMQILNPTGWNTYWVFVFQWLYWWCLCWSLSYCASLSCITRKDLMVTTLYCYRIILSMWVISDVKFTK